MIKRALLLALITTLPLFAGVELTGFGGFQWNGSHEFEWYEDYNGSRYYKSGNFDLEHDGNFGIFINKDLGGGTQLELNWTGNKSIAKWRTNSDHSGIPRDGNYSVFSNYWLIGGLKYFGSGANRFKPFANGGIGVMSFIFDDEMIDPQTFFGVSVGLGAKMMLTDRIGLRFGSRFLIPINFDGVGMSFGTGGVSAGAYGHVPVLQGDIHGGLIINLGGGK